MSATAAGGLGWWLCRPRLGEARRAPPGGGLQTLSRAPARRSRPSAGAAPPAGPLATEVHCCRSPTPGGPRASDGPLAGEEERPPTSGLSPRSPGAWKGQRAVEYAGRSGSTSIHPGLPCERFGPPPERPALSTVRAAGASALQGREWLGFSPSARSVECEARTVPVAPRLAGAGKGTGPGRGPAGRV